MYVFSVGGENYSFYICMHLNNIDCTKYEIPYISLSFVLSEKIRPNDIRNGRFDGEFSILFYNIKTKCHIFVLVFLL